MSEHPIIFSTDMVKAILDGRKTMTRRVIKPQPKDDITEHWTGNWCSGIKGDSYEKIHICPYGQVGDRLWVRQAFAVNFKGQVLTKAESKYIGEKLDISEQVEAIKIKWTPAIFMPRKYSFLILEITEVRVERLQEITAEDAWLEGFPVGTAAEHKADYLEYAVGCFRDKWDSLNAKRGYGWDTNPWVWVISFMRLEDK